MPILTTGAAPAAYSKAFTGSVNTTGSWATVDFTGATWANRDDVFICRIDLRLVGAEDGDQLSLARVVVDAPGTDFVIADHQAGVSLAFVNTPKATSWRWKTSGALDVSMIVWYSTLPEGYV